MAQCGFVPWAVCIACAWWRCACPALPEAWLNQCFSMCRSWPRTTSGCSSCSASSSSTCPSCRSWRWPTAAQVWAGGEGAGVGKAPVCTGGRRARWPGGRAGTVKQLPLRLSNGPPSDCVCTPHPSVTHSGQARGAEEGAVGAVARRAALPGHPPAQVQPCGRQRQALLMLHTAEG